MDREPLGVVEDLLGHGGLAPDAEDVDVLDLATEPLFLSLLLLLLLVLLVL